MIKNVSELFFVGFYYGTGLLFAYNLIKAEKPGIKEAVLVSLAVMNLWFIQVLIILYESTRKEKFVWHAYKD